MRHFQLRTRQFNQIQLAWLLLVFIMLVYFVIMGYQSVLRYETFKATAFDLGNLDQVLWNTLHGRLFVWTNQGDNWFGPPTRLAQHVEPIIIPLSLLYIFHADPRILLLFQTLVLAAGALPVFLLTRKHLPDWPWFAAAMSGAYLISPALLGINIFDFHPVALATPLLLYAILALTYKRYIWFVLACILAGACKEEIPAVVALLGILVIWKYKLPRLGTALIIFGVVWSILAVAVIEPHFYPGTQHNTFWYRYTTLGSTPGTALVNVVLHPWLLFMTFVTFDRVYYLAGLLRSTGFLALLAPEWLLPTIPSLAINLLSGDQLLSSGVYHYNAAIIPFLMMAAIVGMQRVVSIWQGWRNESTELSLDGVANSVPKQHKNGYIPLLGRATLAYSTMTQIFSTHPVVTRSVALIQPRLSSVVYKSTFPWKRLSERLSPLAKAISLPQLHWLACAWLIAMFTLNYWIVAPNLTVFWATHVPGTHEAAIQQLLTEIPPDAPVSAGTSLNPHLSERQYITVFPNITIGNKTVEYVIVDLSTVFPEDRVSTTKVLNQLRKEQFCTLKMTEDVILLGRRDVVHCP